MKRCLPITLLVTAPIAVLNTAGYIQIDGSDVAAIHHLAHLIFPLIAFVIFAVYVARDIHKHGWPTFSWRLNA